MAAGLDQLVQYFQETMGMTITPVSWNDERLPHYLRQLYEFHQVELLGRACLLMFDTGRVEQAPVTIRKHTQVVQRQVDADIIYVPRKPTAYNRKRLVEQKVAFVAPGNQMYLPPLGIDFREHFRRPLTEREAFSPATQALVIHLLLRHRHDPLTTAGIVSALGYTRMTAIRALNELLAAGFGDVCTIGTVGRERFLKLVGEPRALWTKAEPYLRSPVVKRVCLEAPRAVAVGKRAGLTALAELTMLAPPQRPTYALGRAEWTAYRADHHISEVPGDDPAACELEIWSYPPEQLANGDLVDPLSLYLSLKGSQDERVEAALEELLEKITW